MVPTRTRFTPVLDYPRPISYQKGSAYVGPRSLHRCAPLGRCAKRAAYGARDALYSLRPARGGHSQEPLRVSGSRWYGLLADSVRHARAARAGAPETGRAWQERLSRGGALRASARVDEPL